MELVRNAAICRACEGLCVSASSYEEKEQQAYRKRLPMMDEATEIFTYPLTDKTAFVLMVLVVWVFTLARDFIGVLSTPGLIALVFSKGMLMAYAFNALNRASNGQFRGFLPEISGIGDLVSPLWASFIASLSSTWPLIVAAVLGWNSLVAQYEYHTQPKQSSAIVDSVVHAQDDEVPAQDASPSESEGDSSEAEESGTPVPWDTTPAPGQPAPHREKGFVEDVQDQIAGRRDAIPPPPPLGVAFWLLLIFGVVWNVVYTPVALIVAAITRTAGPFSSLVQTLNPLVGIGAIMRMGSTYWQALGLYLALAIPQFILGVALSYIPFVGGLVAAFVDGYASLAIGFALGLAVFKKGDELGLH